MFGINEYLDACQFRRDFLSEQQEWMLLERVEYERDAQRIESEHDRVRQELAGYLIPEVTDEYVTELEERLGSRGLMEIKRDYEKRFAAAEDRTVELEGMDEIQNYEDRIQAAKLEVQKYQPAYDEVKRETRLWNDSSWFAGLFERGYFDVEYSAGLIRRFFDWRAVSFLMADLKKTAELEQSPELEFSHPDDLKKHFWALRTRSEKVDAAYEKRTAERDRIEGLHSEYQNLLSMPERLLADLYRDLGAATIEYLAECPDAVRMRLAGEDPKLNAFLQRDAGMRKQAQYLRSLSVSRIESRIQSNQLEIDKSERKIDKLKMQRSRGKFKHFTQEDITKMRNVKADKWERRRLKTQKMRRKISEFEKYDHGSCSDDYLWWDLFTNRAPADDVYEVNEHRRRNPHWDHRQYRDPFDTNDVRDNDDDAVHVIDDAADDLAASMLADANDGLFDAS